MKVYERVYTYYVELIKKGDIAPGDRMPSLRECVASLGVSRTSAETAYMQLAADGYIYSVEKTGYFVTDMVKKQSGQMEKSDATSNPQIANVRYDFKTISEDPSVSCLNLWRRYMKSALRQEDRLLSYAENQGEEELRCEIASYVRKHRNIICSPEDIVIGAGFQNLLQVLIPLIEGEKRVSFPTKDFKDGATSFSDAGYEVSYRDKSCHVIYVTPAYMTKWGDVMSMKRRQELLRHAVEGNHLIIEDDYQNEFVFSQNPTPSLYALNSGEQVVYLGSFSRTLIPSVRISFIILPTKLRKKYQSRKHLYNQSASKAEQIALAQFLRDGHLNRHVKKMKRLYEDKRRVLAENLEKTFGQSVEILVGVSGMEMGLRIPISNVAQTALSNGVAVQEVEAKDDETLILLSCSGIMEKEICEGVKLLKTALYT